MKLFNKQPKEGLNQTDKKILINILEDRIKSLQFIGNGAKTKGSKVAHLVILIQKIRNL